MTGGVRNVAGFYVLLAIELARRGIAWLSLGFVAAPASFGARLGNASNDECFT
jgi:hypothetical protein